jgi:hypothetical protein
MQQPGNRQFRALMAILVAVYVLGIAIITAVMMLSKGPVKIPALIFSIIFIAAGPALVAGLHYQKEFARRSLMALALLWLVWALKVLTRTLVTASLLAKSLIPPVDLYGSSLVWLLSLALSIAIIHLAMAYPASREAPPGAETLTTAK